MLLVLAALWALATLPRGWTRLAMAVVLAGMGLVLAAGLTENESRRFAGILDPDTLERDESAHGRLEGYEVSWKIFLDHPVIGIGPACWPVYRQKRIDGNKHEPHNLAGQLISTRGVIGTVTFLGYVGSVVAFALRDRRRRRLRAPAPPAASWDRAVSSLAGTTLFTFFLLFVSGLGAHNLDRPAWYLLPALLLSAAAARPEPSLEDPLPAGGPLPASRTSTARSR